MSAPAVDPAVHAWLCASLGLLFAFASAHKLRAPRAFAAQLAEYRLVPDAASLPLGFALGAGELALALALCTPALSRAAALGAALLLALYAGAISIDLARGLDDFDCGCGLAPRPLGPGLVARNGLLAAGALVAALPALPRALGAVDALTIAAGTLCFALLFAAADTLAARRASAA
ncbi:MAG TPA: MauE/DoxX family redox-associated membrane protein [Myxococcota bacterium]|nr:MauE/DoxX family redox-associated membrane protein [Myxococcota bacterium]